MTNFEFYKTKKAAMEAYEHDTGERIANLQDGPKFASVGTSGGRFVSWLYKEYVEKPKDYVVYFKASSWSCSGFLDDDSRDIVCFTHFLEEATKFETEQDAIKAAGARLQKIYKLIDSISDNDKAYTGEPPIYRGKFNKEECKEHYSWTILKFPSAYRYMKGIPATEG